MVMQNFVYGRNQFQFMSSRLSDSLLDCRSAVYPTKTLQVRQKTVRLGLVSGYSGGAGGKLKSLTVQLRGSEQGRGSSSATFVSLHSTRTRSASSKGWRDVLEQGGIDTCEEVLVFFERIIAKAPAGRAQKTMPVALRFPTRTGTQISLRFGAQPATESVFVKADCDAGATVRDGYPVCRCWRRGQAVSPRARPCR
jgi:hypothetical protein